MKIDIMTLFPDTMRAVLGESILGRAAKKGILDIQCTQIRDYTTNKQCQVDDYPYGGGWGCVMMAQPLKACLDDIMTRRSSGKSRVIYMSPQGKPFDQAAARRLVADYDHLVLVCGHYEGIDERFIETCVDEEISIGDFVLTGGELAAMVVTDAVCRLVPGVLADSACYTGESHWDGLLEYPQYTRPEVWEGHSVPEVLKSGNHADVARWRRKQQILRTREKRPDMFARLELTEKLDRQLLAEVNREAGRLRLHLPIACRPAAPEDQEALAELYRQSVTTQRRQKALEWPETDASALLAEDLASGETYVLTHGGETAAAFRLSRQPQPVQESIADGKWSVCETYVTLLRCAVAEQYRGSGMADRLMEQVERLAREQGVRYIRVVCHRKNKAMTALLRRFQYRYRGNVTAAVPEGQEPRRMAYEKRLKKA